MESNPRPSSSTTQLKQSGESYRVILQLRNATIQDDRSTGRSDDDGSVVVVEVGQDVRPVSGPRTRDRGRELGLLVCAGFHLDLVAEVSCKKKFKRTFRNKLQTFFAVLG